MAAARSLAWVTVREAFPFWWRIVALHLGLILVWLLTQGSINGGVDERGWLVAVNPLIALLAGVSVFGTEPAPGRIGSSPIMASAPDGPGPSRPRSGQAPS